MWAAGKTTATLSVAEIRTAPSWFFGNARERGFQVEAKAGRENMARPERVELPTFWFVAS